MKLLPTLWLSLWLFLSSSSLLYLSLSKFSVKLPELFHRSAYSLLIMLIDLTPLSPPSQASSGEALKKKTILKFFIFFSFFHLFSLFFQFFVLFQHCLPLRPLEGTVHQFLGGHHHPRVLKCHLRVLHTLELQIRKLGDMILF